MLTLADRFLAAEGSKIIFEGRELHRDFHLQVKSGTAFTIEFLEYVARPVQGIGLKAEGCTLVVAGTSAKSIGLWTDTAPRRVEILVDKASAGAGVRLFNQWRDEKHGSTMYHLNNAAIEIEAHNDASFLLRCSDGWSAPNFADLVIRIRMLSS